MLKVIVEENGKIVNQYEGSVMVIAMEGKETGGVCDIRGDISLDNLARMSSILTHSAVKAIKDAIVPLIAKQEGIEGPDELNNLTNNVEDEFYKIVERELQHFQNNPSQLKAH